MDNVALSFCRGNTWSLASTKPTTCRALTLPSCSNSNTATVRIDTMPKASTYLLGLVRNGKVLAIAATESAVGVVSPGNGGASVSNLLTLHQATRIRLELTASTYAVNVIADDGGVSGIDSSYEGAEAADGTLDAILGDKVESHGDTFSAKYDRVVIEYLSPVGGTR